MTPTAGSIPPHDMPGAPSDLPDLSSRERAAR